MQSAVIETGGKQYVVKPGQSLRVEKLVVEPKAAVVFDRVLLVADEKAVRVGTPYLEGAKVSAVCEEQGRAGKITVVKFRSKVRYRRTHGHRQAFTRVRIEKISG
jgi:large subunit ribosomal protein L21